jgi:hypothetical protein
MQVTECKRETLYEWVSETIEGHLKLNSSFLVFIVCLALHAWRSCDLKFQNYVGWGRMLFCHEPSFVLRLCIFATPWASIEGT